MNNNKSNEAWVDPLDIPIDEYEPAFHARSTYGRGTRSNPIDWIDSKTIECMSQGEKMLYFYLRWDDNVKEIRTQVKMNLEDIKVIAKELGFSNIGRDYTTDYVVTYADGTVRAYSVKSGAEDIESDQAVRRQTLEYIYWERRNVSWQLILKSNFDKMFYNNIRIVTRFYNPHYVWDDYSFVAFLIAHKQIKVDMKQPIDFAGLTQLYMSEGGLKQLREDINGAKAGQSATEAEASSTEEQPRSNVSLENNLILCDDCHCYRILGILDGKIVVIEMDIKTRNIFVLGSTESVLESIADGKLKIEKDLYPQFRIENMSEAIQRSYNRNSMIIADFNAIYRKNCYLDLATKKSKPELHAIMDKYNISKHSLNILILNYLQSGCSLYSLIDRRGSGLSAKPKAYTYTEGHRPGRKADENSSEVVLTQEVIDLFDQIIDERLSHRYGTYSKIFREIIGKAYGVKLDKDGLVPHEVRRRIPTLEQFYHYKRKKVTKKMEFIASHSETEHRNTYRPLLGDVTLYAWGIGDQMQVDIVDLDMYLKGKYVQGLIGRPHIYFLVDVATRTLQAYFISLVNNSIYGLIGLLNNLAEDKVALAAKYGIKIQEREWPSGIIPGAIYCDNGSDFKSAKIEEIYNRLGIERNLEPPAMGSMKGVVEQEFDVFYDSFKYLFEGSGIIEKDYGSNHKKEARLTLDDIHKIAISFIIYANQRSIATYPLTLDMVNNGVLPRPVDLWNYFKGRYPYRIILNKTLFLYDCMFETTASVTRTGIMFNKSSYLPDPNDKYFIRDMDNHVTSEKISIRYSYLDTSKIIYIRNSHCYLGTLNTEKTTENSLKNIDLGTLYDFLDKRKKLIETGELINMALTGELSERLREIRDGATSAAQPEQMENIRKNVRMEHKEYANEFSPFDRIGSSEKTGQEAATPVEQTSEKTQHRVEFQPLESIGWDAALEDFMD